MEKFLKKIQSLDEGAKNKLLIVISALVSLIVFSLWLNYFATLVQPVNQAPSAGAPQLNFSFWQTMKIGIAAIYHFLADKFSSLVSLIRQPKDYIINPRY